MSEVELYLIQDGENCTIYTLQFLRDVESEFEKFVAKFREDAEYSEDFSRIAAFNQAYRQDRCIGTVLPSGWQDE